MRHTKQAETRLVSGCGQSHGDVSCFVFIRKWDEQELLQAVLPPSDRRDMLALFASLEEVAAALRSEAPCSTPRHQTYTVNGDRGEGVVLGECAPALCMR